ncbi:uncharacterized protein PV09_00312 [Verruconis gallopava]|uniref:TPR-like protein n=1 Tax=Verruconis gallopava TaxID=253628 RepID=A0A0D1Y341_9PEZI|nr:uncharacterized protein PV09_00312 [Verruconis gallopava]KIW09426.1 hypothetical protein PV09_00312 [Verruconis gallopava]
MADANGANGHAVVDNDRYAWMPTTVDIPLGEGDETDVVEISLTELWDDPTELCTLLENENIKPDFWFLTALAYAKQQKMDVAIGILKQGLSNFSGPKQAQDRLGILNALCWMYLWKCRDAPRVSVDNVVDAPAFWASSTQMASMNGAPGGEDSVKTKEHWLREATGALNEASRISPSYPPVFLARGVLSLLRASLQRPEERQDSLRQALKSFDDALRSSGNRNIMATMGKARVLYAMGKYSEAYTVYQSVLRAAPSQTDPDPRIGIGCCLWQLGHHEEAHNAWQRALELRPNSKTALMMNALYWLHASSQLPTTDPKFRPMYNRAMQELTQKAWKVDNRYPIINSTFGNFFMTMKRWPQMQKLAKTAIEQSEVSAIASDGWYLLARMAHSQGELKQALEFYSRSDQARGGDGRGGDDKGYLPAKFGMAQIKVLLEDNVDAKFRLERLYRQNRSPEVMTLLGTLYAEDYFANSIMGAKDEDKAEAWKKAVSLLEAVRTTWKDPKRKYTEDPDVLLNLARLYEIESPEKSMQCLQHVERLQIEKLPEDKREVDEGEDADRAMRIQLPPELINNIGCFQFLAEKYAQATQSFQDALDSCIRVNQEDVDNEVDTDALITSISYNLARSYEAQGDEQNLARATETYEGLLKRHPGYLDAHARLAKMKLDSDPSGEGPKKISEVYHSAEDNLEIRALYGYYLNKAKRKTNNIAEDQEQRHMKHTLRDYNKHDHYSLVAMGNVHLAIAREMDRLTDQDKEKRRKMYHKAVEFFAKALELDEKNAYAVQGLAIAITEDQKNLSAGIQLFTQVREVLKDVSVYMNLGHAYCELKQYARSIENYEAALQKDGGRDATLLACLGRTWLQRAKQENSLQGMKSALDYSQRAYEASRHSVPFKFNVAFVRIQIAQLLFALDKSKRTSADLQSALEGLDEAVQAFEEVAQSPKPPYPQRDIEQRAVMIRNTMRKQLERALEEQNEYEQANASRLAEGKARLEAEKQAREAAERARREKEAEQRAKIMEERRKMQERDQELAAARAEEERRREEEMMTTDEETGERKKRVKKKGQGGKRKKKDVDSESDGDGGTSSRARSRSVVDAEDEGEPRRKKKRTLHKKGRAEKPGKYKSAEFINSEDEDDDDGVAAPAANGDENGAPTPEAPADSPLPEIDDLPNEDGVEDEEDEEEAAVATRKRRPARIVEDEDEMDED